MLTGGLLVSVGLLVVGVVITIARPELIAPRQTSVGDIPRNIAALRPGGFFDLGLLVLLVTPALRVLALLVSFAKRRMWLFSTFCLVVLVALGLSAYFGLHL